MKAYFYDSAGSCIRILHNVKEEPENQYPRALDVVRNGRMDERCLFAGVKNGELVYRAETN